MISRRGFVTGLFAIVPATSLMHLRGVPLDTLLDPLGRNIAASAELEAMLRRGIEETIREVLRPFLGVANTPAVRAQIASKTMRALRGLPQHAPTDVKVSTWGVGGIGDIPGGFMVGAHKSDYSYDSVFVL